MEGSEVAGARTFLSMNSHVTFFFFVCTAWHADLSSQTRDQTCAPLQLKLRVLTTGPPGMSHVMLSLKTPGGTSLASEWLRLQASTAGGTGLTSDQGTKTPHARKCGQKI